MLTTGKRRARFNLLVLEEGEWYFDGYVAYLHTYPAGTTAEGIATKAPRIMSKGRVMLCSRSLVFEPDEISQPITKLLFKYMMKPPSVCTLPRVDCAAELAEALQQSIVLACSHTVTLKAGGIIAPYTTNELVKKGNPAQPLFVISMAHSNPAGMAREAERLWDVAQQSKGAYGAEDKLIKPVLYERHQGPFDMSLLSDFTERPQLSSVLLCERVQPMLSTPGRVMLTDTTLYFQPAPINNTGEPVRKWPLEQVTQVYCRRYLMKQIGLELIMKDNTGVLLSFQTKEDRDLLYSKLMDQEALRHNPPPTLLSMTRLWQQRRISNYEYLMFINNVADRTFNDFTQYPVFPWVIADYSSPTLNLQDPAAYRDLSKPIGALNPSRLEYLKARMRDMPTGDGMPPPFLYGTHYSTPGYVLFFLVRRFPEHMLRLQNGKFDAPDRLFNSIAETWSSCLKNPADLKELIPQFYEPGGDGSFLRNTQHLSLGIRQTGKAVDNVELPAWAADEADMVRKFNAALESDYVSEHLHEWIDLVFGAKQRGQAAVEADNVFYYLTYEGAADLEAEASPDKRAALLAQIREFGQTPKLVFGKLHPKRDGPPAADDLCNVAPSKVLAMSDPVVRTAPPAGARPPAGGFAAAGGSGGSGGGLFERALDNAAGLFRFGAGAFSGFGSGSAAGAAGGGASRNAMWDEDEPTPKFGRGPSPVPSDSKSPDSAPATVVAPAPAPVARKPKRTTRPAPPAPKWRRIVLTTEDGSPLRMHAKPITNVVCTYVERRPYSVFTTAEDGCLKGYNPGRKVDPREYLSSEETLSTFAVSADEQFVFVGCWDGSMSVVGVGTSFVQKIPAHDDVLSTVSADVVGKRIATGSWDGTVKLWGVSRGRVMTTPQLQVYEHTTAVTAVALHPQSKILVSGSIDGLVVYTNVSTGSCELSIDTFLGDSLVDLHAGEICGVTAAVWSTDGTTIVISFASGRIVALDMGGGAKCIVETKLPIRSVATVDGGLTYAAANGTLSVWRTGGDDDNVVDLFGGEDYQDIVLTAEAGKVLELEVSPDPSVNVRAVSISGDGKVLVAGDDNGDVSLWQIMAPGASPQ